MARLEAPDGSWGAFRTQLLLGPKGNHLPSPPHHCSLREFLVSEVGRAIIKEVAVAPVPSTRARSPSCPDVNGPGKMQ